MKPLILWDAEGSHFTDPECQKVIKQMFSGLIVDGDARCRSFWQENKSEFPNSVFLLQGDYEPIIAEFDKFLINEPTQMNAEQGGKIESLLRTHPEFAENTTITEDFPNYFSTINPKYRINYGSYQRFFFRICKTNIPVPFTNQLKTVDGLISRYGNRVQSLWLSLNKNQNDYRQIIQYANNKGLQIMVFVDAGTSKADFLNRSNELKGVL